MIFDSANNNRSIVASRAAEIIMEEGVTDYLFAKRKAAKSLGLLTTLLKSSGVKPRPRPSINRAKAIGAIVVTISIFF